MLLRENEAEIGDPVGKPLHITIARPGRQPHRRVNICPLGSGAIAGSTLPLTRVLVAKLLGFVDASGKPQLTQNSMDAVSDRDFAVEFCAAAALLAVHLSRLAED